MLTRLIPGIVTCLLLAAAVTAGDWTQFRGPDGRAVSVETNLPVKWSAKENLRWKAELPGRGLSNPVVTGGRVFVTASSGYQERRLHVLCFDEATGKKLWERQFASTGSTTCHPTTCMAAPTPASDGKNVFALFATGDLAALDAEGNLLWYRSLVRDYPDITNQVGMASSPVVHKDTLLLGMENAGDSFAIALDKNTGKNLWRTERFRDINWVTPHVVAVNGRVDVLFQTRKELTAYDPKSGKIHWSFTNAEPSSVASPVSADGMVFVPGRELVALRPGAEGATPEVVWKSNKLSASYASPTVYKDRVYGLTGTGLSCLNAKTGEVVWQQRIQGKFWASPVLADDKAYVVTEEGATTVIQLGERPKVLATNVLGENVLATPAIANGAIYLRSDQHLFCIGEKK